MKYNLKNFLVIGLLLVAGLTACEKQLDDAYQNPNATVRVPVETILPSMIGNIVGSSAAAGSAYGIANDGLLIGRYVQYWGTNAVSAAANSGTQYDRMGGTTGASDNMGSMWAAHYFGMGQNITRMIEWGVEEQKWDFVGAAWALRAWTLFEATNMYNNLILREAFNTSLQTFNYEGQEEIYDSVRVLCHRAVAYLSMSGGAMNPETFGQSDYYLNGGNLERWKKFAYGILARSYAYINNKPGYSADSVIKYANLSATTNADNITAKFANTGITGTSNYYGPLRGNVGTIRQSAFIADLMSGVNPGAFTGVFDPRAWYMLRENPNGTFKGIIPGQNTTNSGIANTADQPQNFWGGAFSSTTSPVGAQQGRYIFRNETEFPIMTASEMKFLLAEAYLKKNDPASALTAYTDGISMNFDMLTTKYNVNIPAGKEIDATVKANYLGNVAIVPATAGELTLTMIMLQKYIALYGWGMHETWADMRRFHYTDDDPATGQNVYAGFTPPVGNLFEDNMNEFVYRARPRYNSEYLYNINALESVGAFALNYHTKKTWFAE